MLRLRIKHWRRKLADGLAMVAFSSSADLIGAVLFPTPLGIALGTAWGYFAGYFVLHILDQCFRKVDLHRSGLCPDHTVAWQPLPVLVIGTVLGIASSYVPFSPSPNLIIVAIPLVVLGVSLAATTASILFVQHDPSWLDQASQFPFSFSSIIILQLASLLVAALFGVPAGLRGGILTAVVPAFVTGVLLGFPVELWITKEKQSSVVHQSV